MKRILMLLIICCSFSNMTSSQALSKSVLAALDKVETAMFNATSAGDSSTFRKLASKDYFTINADGRSTNLEAALSDVPKFKGSTYKLSEQTQRVFGNVVLRNGRAKFYFGGQQVAEVLYTTGWIYSNKSWKYIHWQGTLSGWSLQNKPATDSQKN